MEIESKNQTDELKGMAAEYARAYLMDTDTPLEDVIYGALLCQHERYMGRAVRITDQQVDFFNKIMDKRSK